MREFGEKLGVPIEVYGPETHMTKIVSMALERSKIKWQRQNPTKKANPNELFDKDTQSFIYNNQVSSNSEDAGFRLCFRTRRRHLLQQ